MTQMLAFLCLLLCIPVVVSAYEQATTWQFPLPDWSVGTNGFWSCEVSCYHIGEDVAASEGDPVYAPANGLVKEARLSVDENGDGYGGLVIIEHNTGTDSLVSVIGHMNAATLTVSSGDEVSEGQIIGYVGTYSQNGHWPVHTHFGIHKGAYQSGLSCDGNWIYAGYDYSGCTENDWYIPSDFVGARIGTFLATNVDESRTPQYPPGLDYYPVAPGQILPVSFTFDNNGTAYWTNDGNQPFYVELHSVTEQYNADLPSGLAHNWLRSTNYAIATTTGRVDAGGQGLYSFINTSFHAILNV